MTMTIQHELFIFNKIYSFFSSRVVQKSNNTFIATCWYLCVALLFPLILSNSSTKVSNACLIISLFSPYLPGRLHFSSGDFFYVLLLLFLGSSNVFSSGLLVGLVGLCGVELHYTPPSAWITLGVLLAAGLTLALLNLYFQVGEAGITKYLYASFRNG